MGYALFGEVAESPAGHNDVFCKMRAKTHTDRSPGKFRQMPGNDSGTTQVWDIPGSRSARLRLHCMAVRAGVSAGEQMRSSLFFISCYQFFYQIIVHCDVRFETYLFNIKTECNRQKLGIMKDGNGFIHL